MGLSEIGRSGAEAIADERRTFLDSLDTNYGACIAEACVNYPESIELLRGFQDNIASEYGGMEDPRV